jgi:flavodoxin
MTTLVRPRHEDKAMNVTILCDSKFGNTMQLAQSMSAALRDSHTVAVRSADEGLGRAEGIDLLLVGGPTHAHGSSAPLKEALAAIPASSLNGVSVAVFDTRFRMARLLTGSAAASAAKMLRRAGANVVAPPESFFVTRDDPPVLVPGETDRAQSWARAVVG